MSAAEVRRSPRRWSCCRYSHRGLGGSGKRAGRRGACQRGRRGTTTGPAPALFALASRPGFPWFSHPPASRLRARGRAGPAGRARGNPARRAWRRIAAAGPARLCLPRRARGSQVHRWAEPWSGTKPDAPGRATPSLLSRLPRAAGTGSQGWEAGSREPGKAVRSLVRAPEHHIRPGGCRGNRAGGQAAGDEDASDAVNGNEHLSFPSECFSSPRVHRRRRRTASNVGGEQASVP